MSKKVFKRGTVSIGSLTGIEKKLDFAFDLQSFANNVVYELDFSTKPEGDGYVSFIYGNELQWKKLNNDGGLSGVSLTANNLIAYYNKNILYVSNWLKFTIKNKPVGVQVQPTSFNRVTGGVHETDFNIEKKVITLPTTITGGLYSNTTSYEYVDSEYTISGYTAVFSQNLGFYNEWRDSNDNTGPFYAGPVELKFEDPEDTNPANISVAGKVFDSTISTAKGDDTVSIGMLIYNKHCPVVSLGDGDDFFSIGVGGDLSARGAKIYAGAGDDTISTKGSITNNSLIDLGNGKTV